MKRIFLQKWDISKAYTVFLIVFDIVAVNLSTVMAMMLRFNGPLNVVPPAYMDPAKEFMLLNTVSVLVIFALLRLYNSVWRFASIHELKLIGIGVSASVLVNFAWYTVRGIPMFRSYYILYGVALMVITVISRFSYRFLRFTYRAGQHSQTAQNVMIIGGGQACDLVLRELAISPIMDARVRCIIDDDPRKQGTFIRGYRIIGGRDKIRDAVDEYDIDTIIVAMPSVARTEIRKILELCSDLGCEMKIVPGMYQLLTGAVEVAKLRSVKIEDLLGRDEVDVRDSAVNAFVEGKRVLVTGGGGSIGSELCRQVAANDPAQLILLDIYENTAYEVERELMRDHPDLNLEVLVGSVRDEGRMEAIFAEYQPEIVYHAAAHKHVPLMEDSPGEAVKNNVFGTYNVCALAEKYGADRVILISTDKAVNPTNIMGASKRLCEMVIQHFAAKSKGTRFAAVRFGNVLGSHGSVIPIFQKQIEEGGPVTVTHPEIIRYFMTIPEAVSLVMKAGFSAKGGEIFVLDMGEPVKIDDLARNMIRLAGFKPDEDIKIEYTGLRPGEKLYEELLMDEEGLEQTDNKLIYIGKPIAMDEATFEQQLDDLRRAMTSETEDMKSLVQQIVTTYRPEETTPHHD